jgi:DNA-binding PadR family transcriptional regulator
MRHHHRCDVGFADERAHHSPFGRGFGRFGRRGFMGGPGMRAAKMLASGDLRLIILALLSEKPRHGYEIIKAVEEHSSGIYTPSPGMVYPALTYLEDMGHAVSENDGAKKLYRITEAGTAYLSENRASVEETLDQLARFGRRFADFQKRYSEEAEESEDADLRGGIKSEWRQAKMEFRELRGELKSILYEKINASPEERERIAGILRRAIAEIRTK